MPAACDCVSDTDCSCNRCCQPCCTDSESDAVIHQDAVPEDRPDVGHVCGCDGMIQPNLPHKHEQLAYVPAVYDTECQAHGCGNVHPKIQPGGLPIFSSHECGCHSPSCTNCNCGVCRHSISEKNTSSTRHLSRHRHNRKHLSRRGKHNCRHVAQSYLQVPLNPNKDEAKDASTPEKTVQSGSKHPSIKGIRNF